MKNKLLALAALGLLLTVSWVPYHILAGTNDAVCYMHVLGREIKLQECHQTHHNIKTWYNI
jgi:hypothetical protein